MKDLVVATNNKHKLIEMRGVIDAWGVNCLALGDFPYVFQYDEPYSSFMENALHKAREVSKIISLPVLSDDSGLCVEALGGAPGVFSARYSDLGTCAENRKKLLSALNGISNRRATFVCAIVFIRSWCDPCPLVVHGFWQGVIVSEERGNLGFGYDPIFLPDGFEKTASEMLFSVKNKLSHRAQALRKMKEEIQQWLSA